VRRVGLHHVDIVVSSLERSLPLYRDLLSPLVYTDVYQATGERGDPVWYLDGEGVGASLGIREARSERQGHDRYATGLHHLAFEASSRQMVDERFEWA
jgi:glyoxylase I family protein